MRGATHGHVAMQTAHACQQSIRKCNEHSLQCIYVCIHAWGDACAHVPAESPDVAIHDRNPTLHTRRWYRLFHAPSHKPEAVCILRPPDWFPGRGMQHFTKPRLVPIVVHQHCFAHTAPQKRTLVLPTHLSNSNGLRTT